jgi:hypothetical protein
MASDNFNRADGGLGPDWTAQTPLNPPLIISNEASGDGTGIQAAYYGVTSFASSHSSSFIYLGSTANFAAPTVRAQSGANSWYGYFNNGSVQKCTAGTRVVIATFSGYTAGQRAKLSVTGTTLEAFIDGVSQGTVVDASFSGGFAGIAFVGGVFDATVDDWEGDGETRITGSPVLGADGTVTTTRTGLINLDGVTRSVAGSGIEFIGGTVGLIEQATAPAGIANTAIIYAVDDGAGKTRWMVQFPTGSAQQLSVEI